MSDPANLPADLRSVTFSMAAKRGDNSLYDTMWELEKAATLHEEKMRFLGALCSFQDQTLLQTTLERSLDDEHVRSQDTIRAVVFVASNRHGRDLAWQFLKDNWDEFDRRYGEGGFALMRLVSISSLFTTEEKRREVIEFFDAHPVPAADRTIRQGLERMEINIAWLRPQSERAEPLAGGIEGGIVVQASKGALSAVLDILYPIRCLGCFRVGRFICDGCVARMPTLDDPMCRVCASPGCKRNMLMVPR